MAENPRCDTHQEIVGLKYPLPNLKENLRFQRRIKIVAIGSSSTAGEGDIIAFPYRLEQALRDRFHGRLIDVLNRGISGQEAPTELSRFESDVIGEAPVMVIWQVGTNAVFRLRDFNREDVAGHIATGLKWLSRYPIDVVLMDLQRTRTLVESEKEDEAERKAEEEEKRIAAEDMVRRISVAADEAGVNLFRRYELMRHWNLNDGISLQDLTRRDDPLKLHMSEWATDCMARALIEAIKNAHGASV